VPEGEETAAASDQLTAYGSALGTIQYMSPEQARGLEIDARSDIFSLGIVLYEMATGRPPFRGATAAAIFEQIFGGVPPAPSEVVASLPADLDRIVFRALEKDRELRYQSAADLRADLRRLPKALESGRCHTRIASPAAFRAGSFAAPALDGRRAGGDRCRGGGGAVLAIGRDAGAREPRHGGARGFHEPHR
jgi:hypothetical protein